MEKRTERESGQMQCFHRYPKALKKDTGVFPVKLLETNSLKQDFPNQLDKRHHTTNEKVVLMTTDTFLKANSDSLSLKLAIKKR